ncbi:MAG: hypothetical protein SGJ23_15890 [Alphaproteobacteria bacterium]|nr:hypothetical protein [Alphaproteobacteria bacterium]
MIDDETETVVAAGESLEASKRWTASDPSRRDFFRRWNFQGSTPPGEPGDSAEALMNHRGIQAEIGRKGNLENEFDRENGAVHGESA